MFHKMHVKIMAIISIRALKTLGMGHKSTSLVCLTFHAFRIPCSLQIEQTT
uniref:Uncharacterized protein n=1 Tax=Arundo donax TaxID=35708 RepID=A0A0A9BIF2_ARUDO